MPKRRLTGAALYSAVIKECRAILAEYGIPAEEYQAEMLEPYSLGSDMQPILAVRFTRGKQTIIFDNIYPGDSGEFDQYSAPELR